MLRNAWDFRRQRKGDRIVGLIFAVVGFAAFFAMWVLLPKFLQNRARAE